VKKHFTFYFPYRGFGGVPILFLRVAERLVLEGYACTVVDYADGYMAKNRSSHISLIEFKPDLPLQIPLNSSLIFQSDLPWGIPTNLICDDATKIIFWNCYPFNFIPVLPNPFAHFFSSRLKWLKLLLNTLLLSPRNKCKKLVHYLTKHQAVYFMDKPNWWLTQWALGIKNLPQNYLPIVVNTELKPELQPKPILSNATLRLAWVGRIADFKIHSLIRIFEDLKKLVDENQARFHFTIIGSGSYEAELKAAMKPLEQFEIRLISSIDQNELHSFLNREVDLLFAMGTSALEGGLAKIPTILMNFSYSSISDRYRYTLLKDVESFSLGELITPQNISIGKSLSEILKDVKKNKIELAHQTSAYVQQHHSIEKYLPAFIENNERNQLTYNQLIKECDLQKPWFYKIWSYLR
jgi:glycosyltransferase involved in cell wall biosynthesis